MIPLSFFILGWLVLLAIYGLLSFFSLVQMIRYCVAGPMAYFSSLLFILVAAGVIGSTVLYVSQTDLQAGLDMSSIINVNSPIITQ